MPLLFLRNRNLGFVWLGQLASQAGTRMYLIALSWWIVSHDRESGGLAMGALLVVGSLPSLLFVRPIGRAIDALSTKRLILVTDAAALVVCLAFAGIAATGAPSHALIFGTAFLLALNQAVMDPALNKALPALARPEEVDGAVALLTSTTSLANLVGAGFGAASIAAFGLVGAMVANAASYGAALICTAAARFGSAANAPSSAAADAVSEPVPELATGWRLLAGRPFLRALLLSFGCVNFFSTPTLVVMPMFIERVLGGTAASLAIAEATLAAGFIAGAFAIRFVPRSLRSLTVGGWATLVAGVAVFASGRTGTVAGYGAALFVVGAAISLANVKFIGLFQRVVPDAEKGRFFALLGAVASFTFPVAFFLAGYLSDHLDLRLLCAVQGAGMAALALGYFAAAPKEDALSAEDR